MEVHSNLVIIKVQTEIARLCLQGMDSRHLPARPVPDGNLNPYLHGGNLIPSPWPLMSTVFLNDLRALEFPDSNNFHVNLDPLAVCPLYCFLGCRFSGPDTAGHFRT